MKCRITLKDCNALELALEDVQNQEDRDKLESYFKWKEYLTLEVDLETDEVKLIKP